ncbi:MAG: FG-GAP-like repeat-containing protein [Myxococcota bacterium]
MISPARASLAALTLCAGASLAAPIVLDAGTPTDARIGSALAPAGDFDRDGFPDVVVGASNYGGAGAVFILSGASGLTRAQRLDFQADVGGELGASVAGGCDLNGDGAVDVVAGAPNADTGLGAVVVFFGGAAPPMPKVLHGVDASGRFGEVVACVPDVDGVPGDDLVVGAPMATSAMGDIGAGALYLFPGGPGGPSETVYRIFRGEGANERLGASVASAGDTDGDGRTDLVVGAPGFITNAGAGFAAGGVMLLRLVGGQFNKRPLATDDRSLVLPSEFGASVAALGDVNGDGQPDFAVGAPKYDGYKGAVFLYTLNSGNFDFKGLLEGESSPAQLGGEVSGPGDFNGDGYADLLASATGLMETGSLDRGAAYVYLGGSKGLRAEPLRLPASALGTTSGFGEAVAGVGDVDRDGFADVVVGAPFALSPDGMGSTQMTGVVHFFPGRARGPSTESSALSTPQPTAAVAAVGDVNGDGFDDFVAGTPGGGTNSGELLLAFGHGDAGMTQFDFISYPSADPAARFGASVAAAGDVNGDGFADVLVGAPTMDLNGQGSAWLYLGSFGGLLPPTWSFRSQAPGDRLGQAVAGVGDVNGDGYDDVAVAAPAANGRGAVYLFFGGAQGPAAVPGWTIDGPSPGAFFGASLAPAGDSDLDGFADFAVGAPGADLITLRFGHGTGPAIVRERILVSTQVGLGAALCGGGDVDGDGLPDVVALATPPQASVRGRVVAVTWRGTRDLAQAPPPSEVPLFTTSTTTLPSVSVALAGDVDGDGRADVLVGYPDLGGGGAVQLVRGSASDGLQRTNWAPLPLNPLERQGASVSGGRDLNGDGYPELLVAAPSFGVRVYAGGDEVMGRPYALAQRFNGEARGQGYRAAATEQVSFEAVARDEMAGLELLVLEVEVKPVDIPFDGQGTTSSLRPSKPDLLKVDFKPPGPGRYHWRARVVSGDRAGHWRTWGGSDETRTDFSWGLVDPTLPDAGGPVDPPDAGSSGDGGVGPGTPPDPSVIFDTSGCNCSGVAEGPLLVLLAAGLLTTLRRRR